MTKIFGFGYLLTHRCNQDCLENLYCQVRGRNGPDEHPTPVDYLYRIKSIILGKNPGLSVELHSNTIEQDPEEYVSAKFMKHLSRDGYTSAIVEQLYDQGRELGNIGFLENCDVTDEVQNEPDNLAEELIEDYSNDQNDQLFVDDSKDIRGTCIHLEIEILNDSSYDFLKDEITSEFIDDLSIEMKVDEIQTRRNQLKEDGLEYIAGWIAWKFKRSYPVFPSQDAQLFPVI
ncbi:Transposable element P transposase [Pseudolycoriella hygida]|uniref:Transposable element P transposase n=1 Tax=Pseudolycoriella hygida TaxID=35572 RepID=A0A9Q0N7J7_9DIPT|nr:Transposable element P transposase [Pseudolycoriella hygida]